MIFSIIIPIALIFSVFFSFPAVTLGSAGGGETDHTHIDSSDYQRNKEIAEPDIRNFILDLDASGENEEITIKSFPGFLGDQNTEIYIGLNTQPSLVEIGFFYAMQADRIDASHSLVQLQLQTGQSINTLFYTYKNGQFSRVPVSTEKPSLWHGIISRNRPELADIDDDGSLELIAYYNFLHDRTRRVEVYEFSGKSFNKIREYEEMIESDVLH